MAVIPVHSSCLRGQDFVPYLVSALRARAYRGIELEDVWRIRLDRAFVPTPTGRHALQLFLELHRARLEPGAEVVVAGYNFYVIIRILIQFGLVPVFADIEPSTLCVNPRRIAERITARTRMVVVTHMFGNPADTPAIAKLCRAHDLLLFEDCAHAIGTLGEDRLQVGHAGDGALFSFGIQKIVNTFGGGMLAVDPAHAGDLKEPCAALSRAESFASTFSRAIASAVMHPALAGWLMQPVLQLSRTMARHGWSRLSRVLEPARDDPGYRFSPNDRPPFKAFMRRMLELQLARLDENVRRRREVRQEIRGRLNDVEEIRWLDEDLHGRSNAAYFGILVPSPEELSTWLLERGIMTNAREFYDCSRLGQFADYAGDCRYSSDASDHLLRLPSYPNLTGREIARIAEAIRSFFARAGDRITTA